MALARRAAAGDRAALHAVVERHVADLFRLARGLSPTAADAEDVVQDTLIAAFRAIGTFDGRASLLTWMSRILVRRSRKAAIKRGRRTALSLDEASDLPKQDAKLIAGPPGDDGRLDLAAALPKMAPEYREVIVLRELQGLSYAEIATALGVPQGTVESRIHRAGRNCASGCERTVRNDAARSGRQARDVFEFPSETAMDCEYRTRLDAFHDGELPPAAAREVERHLETCPVCAAELAEIREVADSFGGMAQGDHVAGRLVPGLSCRRRRRRALPRWCGSRAS